MVYQHAVAVVRSLVYTLDFHELDIFMEVVDSHTKCVVGVWRCLFFHDNYPFISCWIMFGIPRGSPAGTNLKTTGLSLFISL